jgi:hypothetical protein
VIGQYAAVFISLIMTLANTIGAVAQSQNGTNETNIGGNQNVSGNISAFGVTRSYDPRTVEEIDATVNETELQNPRDWLD